MVLMVSHTVEHGDTIHEECQGPSHSSPAQPLSILDLSFTIIIAIMILNDTDTGGSNMQVYVSWRYCGV